MKDFFFSYFTLVNLLFSTIVHYCGPYSRDQPQLAEGPPQMLLLLPPRRHSPVPSSSLIFCEGLVLKHESSRDLRQTLRRTNYQSFSKAPKIPSYNSGRNAGIVFPPHLVFSSLIVDRPNSWAPADQTTAAPTVNTDE